MFKRLVAVCLILLLALAALPALADAPLTLSTMDPHADLKITLRQILRAAGENTREHSHYHVQQGSCTDGKYAYQILESQSVYKGSLWKYDISDWSLVKNAYGIEIDHGNDIAYNPRLNRLVVCHNKPQYQRLSLLDPETFEIEKSIDLPFKLYGVTYNESRDQYVVGISGTYDFAVLDADFNQLAYYHGQDTGLVKQGLDCDDRYIYFAQNSSDTLINRIQVYDWEGNFINYIRVVSYQEIESLFHVGDDLYIAFNAGGGYLFKATLAPDSMAR